MESYLVDLDVTMSVRIYIDANNAEKAKDLAVEKIKKQPHFYLRHSAFVEAVVVDIFEELEEDAL